MRLVEPRLVCRRKRGREYCRWEIDVGAETPAPHVILTWTEWLRILEMADRYLALLDLVKKAYFEKEYGYEFLREWLVEEMRHLEKLARSFEEKGDIRHAEDVRFRVSVYTEELRHRKQELEKMRRVLREVGIDV